MLIGDGAFSSVLNGSPIVLTWYGDLDSTENRSDLGKASQSTTDQSFTAKPKNANLFWLKLRLQISGHSADTSTFYYPVALSWSGEFDLTQYTYASVVELAVTANLQGQNRP
jgi:hypothetical protein